MGSSLSTQLGTGLARIGPVARIVHEYIGGATVALAYGRGLTDASEACGADGDIYAIHAFSLCNYTILLSAIQHGKNQFALDLMAGRFATPILYPQIRRMSDTIVQYKNIEFLRSAICRYDTSSNIKWVCSALACDITVYGLRSSGGIVPDGWWDTREFIARCITMQLPKQYQGHDVTNHFVTARYASAAIPFIHEALPDSEDAARFEREVGIV